LTIFLTIYEKVKAKSRLGLLKMGKRIRLLILDCTSATKEKKSEGSLLWELMRIIGYEKRTRLVNIRGKVHFFKELENIEEPYMHISAHGDYDQTKGSCIITPKGARIYSDDFNDLWEDKNESRIPKLVVLSACETGHTDMVRAFSKAGCRYCIAPLYSTYWDDAAVFSIIFYKLLIGEKMSPWISYKSTMHGINQTFPKISGAWSFYERGEKILIE